MANVSYISVFIEKQRVILYNFAPGFFLLEFLHQHIKDILHFKNIPYYIYQSLVLVVLACIAAMEMRLHVCFNSNSSDFKF